MIESEFKGTNSTKYEASHSDETTMKPGRTKEQFLLNELQMIAKEVNELEKIKTHFTEMILHNLEKLDFSKFISYPQYNIKESIIIKRISSSNLGGLNVVSVDGSSVVKKFMNIDFSFLKAIAVKYRFYKNHTAKIEYYPDLCGFNNYSVQANFITREENLVDSKVSMEMNFMEINLLNTLIEESPNIDIIIVDGSIVIMPINFLFSRDSDLLKNYDKLVQEYEKLYSNCLKKGIILIGSIKDTRTSALSHLIRDSIQMLKPSHSNLGDFIKINYRQVFNYFSDLDLFGRLLKKSERSCIFNCKRDVEPIRDAEMKKNILFSFPFNFYAFYLKTTNFDSPCRIEFLMDEKERYDKASERADLISSVLLPISSLNEHYGLPIPQIEAHRRAVFKPQEINFLNNSLTRTLNSYGISLLEKRRNRRPF